MNNVIEDHETKEYAEGWNANNRGHHFLSNPYSCIYKDGEQYRCWQKGYEENQKEWEGTGVRGEYSPLPQPKRIYEGMPSAIDGKIE